MKLSVDVKQKTTSIHFERSTQRLANVSCSYVAFGVTVLLKTYYTVIMSNLTYCSSDVSEYNNISVVVSGCIRFSDNLNMD